MAFYQPGRPFGDPRRLTGNDLVNINLGDERPPPPVTAGPLDNLKPGGLDPRTQAMEQLKRLMRSPVAPGHQQIELQRLLDTFRPVR
jgi:hypothetical protein